VPNQVRHASVLGFIAGTAGFGGTVYWIAPVVRTFGGLPAPLAVLIAGALVAYLALYPALFAAAVSRIARRSRGAALLLAPAVWVGTELARSHLFGGFPWVLLGYSQTSVLPIAQLASLFGVYGVSALVASVSAGVTHVLLAPSWAAFARAASVGAVVAACWGWGSLRLQAGTLTAAGSPMRVAVVQGNVRQEDKWDPAQANAIFDRYLTMTLDAAQQGAGLVIWPESATPFVFEDDSARSNRIRDLTRSEGVTLLFGSVQVDRRQTPAAYYNAAFLLRPDGGTAGVYRKVRLVPFGEYVPLARLLFFVRPVVEGAADFSPGDGVTTLPVDGSAIATAICYEIVYPALVRESVRAGGRLLTTITNDAWFGDSSAPHQHFTQAAMRAVEQGRYLVRSANTGISGIVDPYGRVLARSALFEPAVLAGDVRLLGGLTVYGRIGDVFAYGCALLTISALASGLRRRSSRRPDVFVNACAASLIPSASVRYGWNAVARSSIVRPCPTARAAS